ncbi:MAG: hypothetical protein FD126_1393, partial [Elusimicrobia bacterium]
MSAAFAAPCLAFAGPVVAPRLTGVLPAAGLPVPLVMSALPAASPLATPSLLAAPTLSLANSALPRPVIPTVA